MKFKQEKRKGKLIGIYNSRHSDKKYKEVDYFVTKPVEELKFDIKGVVGDRHYGTKTKSGGRFLSLYKRGTNVRNNRMWSATSPKELEIISDNMLIEKLTPEMIGANLLIDGIDKLSELPSMTYLVFSPFEDDFKPGREEDVVLVVYGQALPCLIAGRGIANELREDEEVGKRFPKSALGKRGIAGWVEKGGVIRKGYTVWVMFPTGLD